MDRTIWIVQKSAPQVQMILLPQIVKAQVVKADQCAQYVDDIGIAANTATHLTRKIRAVFKCIHYARLKLTIEKCHLWIRQNEFLGRTKGISPQTHKI